MEAGYGGSEKENQIPTLPALRTLGNMADVRQTIVTDTREQTLLVFTNLATVADTLTIGDYAPRGLEHRAARFIRKLAQFEF